MKFQEYDLYNAIHEVYIGFEKSDLKPRSADWLIYPKKRKHLKKLVMQLLEGREDIAEEEILKAWDDFGKNKEKYKLLIGVARQHGAGCFYEGQARGSCSDTMSVERLPLARHEPMTIENCVVVCKRHNSDRR